MSCVKPSTIQEKQRRQAKRKSGFTTESVRIWQVDGIGEAIRRAGIPERQSKSLLQNLQQLKPLAAFSAPHSWTRRANWCRFTRKSTWLKRLECPINDRDLRLVQGSALDRLLSDKALRSRLASELAKHDVQDELTDNAKEVLKALDLAFKAKSLPAGLALAITGGQGLSITALIGLTAEREGVPLPLASWGAGTRRIAALTIAEQNQGESPITLVDEAERGLEPYRQRSLMEKLQEGKSQVFVTTHSTATIFAGPCSVRAHGSGSLPIRCKRYSKKIPSTAPILHTIGPN